MDNIYNGQKMHVTVEWMTKKYEEMNLGEDSPLELA